MNSFHAISRIREAALRRYADLYLLETGQVDFFLSVGIVGRGIPGQIDLAG